MIKVNVLLSTYNGEIYINEQIDSIVSYNEASSYKIYIRDDGSIHNTLEILKSYANSENIKLFRGENIGSAKSFFELLRLSLDEAEYFAFCDQDDVWEAEKLSRAVEKLDILPQNEPAMFFCRLNIVDENLKHLGYSKIPKKSPSLGNAILENIAIGATVVINKAARDLILTQIPQNAVMHDWWVYLVVSAFGNIVYDEKPLIKYRQHGTNVVGYKVGFINSFINRLKRYTKQKDHKAITRQVQEFYDIYGDKLDTDKRKLVYEFLYSRNSFFNRLKYSITCNVYRQSGFDNIIFKILLLLDKV